MVDPERQRRMRLATAAPSTAIADGEGAVASLGIAERARRIPATRVALVALLLFTALAYTWDLSASGYANSFYAAAVEAGTKSWKAFFFGSLDSSNFITVDKPPASLWVMALSARVFGFSSWSLLLPQALEGVAAVALLHASVKRWFGAGAGLLAGLLFAITPVAALMFRFDNPDALLVLLLVASAYCLTRALEAGGTRWLLAAGTLIGFAFLTKMMQAFLVLPAFALVYVVAAPRSLRARVGGLLAGGAALIVSAGWWIAIVALWPAGSRPMIDGSPDNNIFNLIFEYNGLDRIFGGGAPGAAAGAHVANSATSRALGALAGPGSSAGAGPGGGTSFSGATGVLRLFNDLMGGQASWLLPAALVALAASLWMRRRTPRTDRTRAALLLWGGWLLVTGAVFSFSSGVIHTYYTVALAPAIAAVLAIGARQLWRARQRLACRVVLAAGVALCAGWSWALLARTPNWEVWLRPTIAVVAVLAVTALLALPALRTVGRGAVALAITLAIGASAAGSLAYAVQTVTTPHSGSVPAAGPDSGGSGGLAGPGGGAGFSGLARPRDATGLGSATSPRGATGPNGVTGPGGAGSHGSPPSLTAGAADGGAGGTTPSVAAALRKALERGASSYRWVAAVSGSQSAAELELATSGDPVMAIGGFNGNGGNISLARFEQYVKAGEIHYFIVAGAGGQASASGLSSSGAKAGTGRTAARNHRPTAAGNLGGGGGGGTTIDAVESWVRSHYKSQTIGGETVYDLTAPKR